MKKAMVSELKTRLSWYLGVVRKGQTVVVCDRATPIARLVPYEPDDDAGFEITPAVLPARSLTKLDGVRPSRSIDVAHLLREDRDAR